jgi:hypothetical protein
MGSLMTTFAMMSSYPASPFVIMMKPDSFFIDATARALYPGLSPEWAMRSPAFVCSIAHPRPHENESVTYLRADHLSQTAQAQPAGIARFGFKSAGVVWRPPADPKCAASIAVAFRSLLTVPFLSCGRTMPSR